MNGTPFVKNVDEETGNEYWKLDPYELDAAERYRAKLVGHSEPVEGDYGPYIHAVFVDVDGDGEEKEVIISSTRNSPGYLEEDGDPTVLDGMDGVDPRPRGKSLLETVYEAPLDSENTVFLRFEDETESGQEYSVHWFGVPSEPDEDEQSEAAGVEMARGRRASS